MRKIKYLTVFILLAVSLMAQSNKIGTPIITNYHPIDYHGHFQTWDAIQDEDGLVYFANGDGIMVYDGKNWEITELQNHSTPRCLIQTKSGKIYVAGENLLGYISVDSVNNLKFNSILDKIPEEYKDFKSIWEFQTNGETVYAQSFFYLFVINGEDVKIYPQKEQLVNIHYSEKNGFIISNRNNYGILKNDSILFTPFDKYIASFFEKNDTTYFVTLDEELYYFDKDFKPVFLYKLKYDLAGANISKITLYNSKYLFYHTFNQGLIILDFKGNLILKLNKDSGLNGNTVYDVLTDKLGNLWIQSSNGISYVEINSPITVINENYGLEISHPLLIHSFNDLLFFCGGYKFYNIAIDTDNIAIAENINQAIGQSWDAINIGEGMYVAHNTRIIRLDKKGNTKTYGPPENVWTIKKIPNTDDKYLLGTTRGLYIYRYNGDSLKYVKKVNNYNTNSREIIFDRYNNLWIGNSTDGLYKIRLSDTFSIDSIKLYNKNNGLVSTNSIVLTEWKDQLLISTYKTLLKFDYNLDSIVEFKEITDKFNTEGKKILQLIGIDNHDNFWFEYYNENYDAEVYSFKQVNGVFEETNFYAKRLMNYSLSLISNYKNKNTLIATTKGLVFIEPDQDFKYAQNFKPLIRKIYFSTEDSLLFGGSILDTSGKIIHEYTDNKKLVLEFKNNNLRFIYAAPFYIAPEYTTYRVMLKNYDTKWSSWTNETKKEYTNLPPGDYVFMVEAKNVFGQISDSSTFKITIKAPWYRTFIAYVGYVLIVILFLYAIVLFFTYRLKRRNEKLEELVNERTFQIQQKNTELEQQKEEILTQAEELQIVNQELEKLSTIVRETDNAIILTDKEGNFIWINYAFTKIFGYTLEELVNNVSKNLIAETTDPKVKTVVNKCLNEKVTVEYEMKITSKFGQVFWVHSTLTPILDDEGEITSLIAIDSDITAVKDAEKQIREQRDQITASIRYARTIQESVLPAQPELDSIFENFVIFKPKDIVSGDFYWISNLFTTIDNRLTHVRDDKPSLKVGYTTFFAVVDCTGHGVPGAFMSLISSHLLGEIINEQRHTNPKEILELLDINLSKALKRSNTKNYDGMVISLCRFDKIIHEESIKTKVTFSGAKQHITYYKKSEQKLIRVKGSIRQIGFVINEELKFTESTFYLDKGDTIFMYSDGLKDLNNKERKSFGRSKIKRIITENIEKQLPEIGDILTNEMNNWQGDSMQRDDITFIGLRIK